jgi:hypothetical protein
MVSTPRPVSGSSWDSTEVTFPWSIPTWIVTMLMREECTFIGLG